MSRVFLSQMVRKNDLDLYFDCKLAPLYPPLAFFSLFSHDSGYSRK